MLPDSIRCAICTDVGANGWICGKPGCEMLREREKDTRCADCGAVFAADGFTPGYATLRDTEQQRVCYTCADRRQRSEMKMASVFYAYLSGDGKRVTTWTGGELARVTMETEARTGFHRSTITAIRAVAPDGSRWYGKGAGRGMCITIRRAKGR